MVAAAYLLLLTFASGDLKHFGAAKLRALNASPYDGAAISVSGPYDSSHHSLDEFDPALVELRGGSHKQIWPMVFLNRIIGCVKCPRLASAAVFGRIKVMDVQDRAGALGDFYAQFGIALALAAALKAPGVVVDPEPYNDESITFERLSDRLGQDRERTAVQLEQIGAHMADMTAHVYPGAVIWFLYTGLDRMAGHKAATPPAAYIALGALRRAQGRSIPLKLVSGGELLGYCFSSLKRLKRVTDDRKISFAPLMAVYPQLALAGAITLWNDSSSRRGWLLNQSGQEAECGRAGDLNGRDFIPLLRYLLSSYPYVWIYAAGVADYNPYGSKAPIFNQLIDDARSGSNTTPWAKPPD